MKVKVTKKHILKGIPYEHNSCPIALAIASNLHLNRNSISVYRWNSIGIREKMYQLKNNKKFITNFDNGRTVKPFTAVLVPYTE